MKLPIASVLAAVCLLAATGLAETVYLLGGKQVTGTVTRSGDKVIVESPDGKRQTFDARDVLYVAKTTGPTETGDPGKAHPPVRSDPPEARPGTERPPTPLPGQADASLRPDFRTASKPFTFNQARRPESIVYLLMRSRGPGGLDFDDLEVQIRRWRANVKDRLRRSGRAWLGPEEFIRIRARVEADFQAAEDEYRDITRHHRRRHADGRRSEPDDRDFAPVYRKLQRTAMLWPDPAIRDFLAGVACLKLRQYKQADMHFQRAARKHDLIAAFHQGRGLAAMGNDLPLDALEPFTRVCRLQPQSRYAVDLLRWAVREVPGARMDNESYRQAKALLAGYPEDNKPPKPPRDRDVQVTWLLPGQELRISDDEMPLPFYDRLDTFQAIGVPVDEDALLVDADAVEKAHEIFVRLGPDVFVPATVSRRSRTVDAEGNALPDLVVVKVEGVKFKPLSCDPGRPFKPGDAMAMVRLSFHQTMQRVPEVIGLRAGELDENGQPRISVQARPGDAAGPVLTPDRRLVGFVAARTSAQAEQGGVHRLWLLSELKPILRRVGSSSIPSYGTPRKIQAEPIQADRPYFVIYGTFGERFQDRQP